MSPGPVDDKNMNNKIVYKLVLTGGKFVFILLLAYILYKPLVNLFN